MKADRYIRVRQKLWATRHGVKLVGSQGERGEPAYVTDLEENLFEPLSDQARNEFEHGDGKELGTDSKTGNMYAVHSSSALGCNVFHFWKRIGDVRAIAEACGLPAAGAETLRFEAKLAVCDPPDRNAFPLDPNIDVLVRYGPQAPVKMSGIECKFAEAYGSWKKDGLRRSYLKREDLWTDLPACRKLAEAICPEDDEFRHLQSAQLLKHILGLKHACGKGGFYLLYLWYDAHGEEGHTHRREVNRFAEVARSDGIAFRSLTYQELILRLADKHPAGAAGYTAYLVERYL